jgi:hypothetical protein
VHDVIDAIVAAPVLPQVASLTETFAGTVVEPMLRRALVEALEIEKDPEIVRVEFLHALRTLAVQSRVRRREELARDSNDPAARAELAALLAEDAASKR